MTTCNLDPKTTITGFQIVWAINIIRIIRLPTLVSFTTKTFQKNVSDYSLLHKLLPSGKKTKYTWYISSIRAYKRQFIIFIDIPESLESATWILAFHAMLSSQRSSVEALLSQACLGVRRRSSQCARLRTSQARTFDWGACLLHFGAVLIFANVPIANPNRNHFKTPWGV